MTKFIKIHIEGVLPIPDGVHDSIDVAAEHGLEVFKGLLRMNVPNIVPGTIAGSWQSMPSSWNPPKPPINVHLPASYRDQLEVQQGLPMQVVDAEEGEVSLTGGAVGRVTHPWDQDLWIFPEDHPLHNIEAEYRAEYMNPQLKPKPKAQLKEGMAIAADAYHRTLELEAGDDAAS